MSAKAAARQAWEAKDYRLAAMHCLSWAGESTDERHKAWNNLRLAMDRLGPWHRYRYEVVERWDQLPNPPPQARRLRLVVVKNEPWLHFTRTLNSLLRVLLDASEGERVEGAEAEKEKHNAVLPSVVVWDPERRASLAELRFFGSAYWPLEWVSGPELPLADPSTCSESWILPEADWIFLSWPSSTCQPENEDFSPPRPFGPWISSSSSSSSSSATTVQWSQIKETLGGGGGGGGGYGPTWHCYRFSDELATAGPEGQPLIASECYRDDRRDRWRRFTHSLRQTYPTSPDDKTENAVVPQKEREEDDDEGEETKQKDDEEEKVGTASWLPRTLLTVTTCRRLDSFLRSFSTLLGQVAEPDLISEALVMDDNSSEHDRRVMALRFPWVRFWLKGPQDKGHPRSMNLIRQVVAGGRDRSTPHGWEFQLHTEDDWDYPRVLWLHRCQWILCRVPRLMLLVFCSHPSEWCSGQTVGVSPPSWLVSSSSSSATDAAMGPYWHYVHHDQIEVRGEYLEAQLQRKHLGLWRAAAPKGAKPRAFGRWGCGWPSISFRPALWHVQKFLATGVAFSEENPSSFEFEAGMQVWLRGLDLGLLDWQVTHYEATSSYVLNETPRSFDWIGCGNHRAMGGDPTCPACIEHRRAANLNFSGDTTQPDAPTRRDAAS